MPARDGEARAGRFIKRDDPLLKTVAVSDFALEEISESFMLMADNLDGNIYHMDAHDARAQEMGVKEGTRVMTDLMTPEMRRPLLRPMDFTEEWRKQRSKNARRSNMDEDEAWDAEFEAARAQQDERRRAEEASEAPNANDLALMKELEAKARDAAAAPAPEPEAKPAQTFRIQRQGMDEMGGMIAKAGIHAETNTMPLDRVPAAAQVPEPAVPQRDFVPLTAAVKESEGVAQPEEAAVERYHAQLNERKLAAEEEARLAEEAKARGYRDGFREGEEKAALQLMQNNQETLAQVARLVESLETLKTSILRNAQENFQVLCQALMESLLRREFSVNPESFKTIVQRAIDETITNDQFRIRVNPANYQALEQVLDEKLKKRLTVDENVKEGDFRIETNLSVVDGNVTQLVRDLLDGADLDLFDQNTLPKVG